MLRCGWTLWKVLFFGGPGTRVVIGLILGFLSASCVLRAETPSDLVDAGNAAFAAGRYEEALEFYEQASVEAPESAEVVFNKGNIHYRREDYSEATDAFREAARKSLEPGLEARCHYNLGNVAFRESERQRDSDLKECLKACEQSITHYQDALERDPEIPHAARNIEVVRLTIKTILDEIKKREEQQKKQQQARQEAAKKIEELLKRQREATSYGGELIRRAGRERETPTWKQDTAGAADRQGRLRDDTATVADELGQQSQAGHQQQLQGQGGMSGPGGQGGMPQQGPQMPGVLDQAKQHLDQAVGFQEQATGKLADNQPTAAQPRQKGAEEQLEKALEALNKKEEGDQQQQQQQQQQAGDEDQKKEGEENEGDEKKEQKNEEKEGEKQSQEGEQRKKEEEEGQQKQAQAVPDEKARDILDEERENRERRRPRQSSGHRAIDRDW